MFVGYGCSYKKQTNKQATASHCHTRENGPKSSSLLGDNYQLSTNNNLALICTLLSENDILFSTKYISRELKV